MIKLRNPLPQSLRDDKNLTNFYGEFNLVPYAGTNNYTSHRMLKILFDLYDLSPSHAACIDNKAEWAFEGNPTVTKATIPGVRTEDSLSVEASIAQDFSGRIADRGLTIDKMIDCSFELDRYLSATGTTALLITEAEVGGEKAFDFESVHPLNFMFLKSEGKNPESVAIGESLYLGTFNSRTVPREVKIWPEWTDRDGLRETVVILRNKRDYSKYYGRPKTLPEIWWMLIEWQIANHTGKISASDLVSLAFLFLEKPGPNVRNRDGEPSSGKKAAIELRKIATNRGTNGESEALGVMEYPHGLTAPKLETVDISRDSKWLESVTEKAASYIYAGHNWSKVISGFEKASSGIGSETLINEFIVCNQKAIRPKQAYFERFWKGISDFVLEATGGANLTNYQISFENRIDGMIEALQVKGSGNTTDGNGGN